MTPKLSWAVCMAGALLAASTVSTMAEPNASIPAKFQGAGCNLRYAYSSTPKRNASECIAAKKDHKEGEGHNNDNFIRITAKEVAGVEWGCSVKTVTSATDTVFTYNGDCSDEGSQFSGAVTLLLRPGKLVIVDLATEGLHTIGIYHLLDGLE
jgi:hypothetical protein